VRLYGDPLSGVSRSAAEAFEQPTATRRTGSSHFQLLFIRRASAAMTSPPFNRNFHFDFATTGVLAGQPLQGQLGASLTVVADRTNPLSLTGFVNYGGEVLGTGRFADYLQRVQNASKARPIKVAIRSGNGAWLCLPKT
jgi:hypothetical protein